MAEVLILDRHIPRSAATLGGGDRYLEHLSAGLIEAGHRVRVGVNIEATYESFLDGLRAAGVVIHPVDLAATSMADAYDELIHDLAPDLVHVHYHGPCMTAAVVRMRALRSLHLKRTVTMHLPFPTVACLSARKLPLRARVPYSWYWRIARHDRKFLSLFDQVLCVSQRHAEVLGNSGLVSPGLVKVIPNGVDTQMFSPGPAPRLRAGEVVVGAVGNLCEQKRFDVLIAAIASVAKGHSVKLVIAGAGPDEQKLRDQAERSGLGAVVDFVGYQDDMPGFLRSLDVFAMTSSEEGSPYAALEAMSVGLPVVATAVGDLPYFIRDGIEGYIVPRGDASAVSSRLGELVASPGRRAAMGARARERVLSKYSHERWRSSTVEAFQSLLSPAMLRTGEADGRV